MEFFLRERRGRYYIYERTLLKDESVIAELPLVIYRNSLFDLGVSSTDTCVEFYVTYSLYPEDNTAIWEKLQKNTSNKSVRAIKVINNSDCDQRVCMRVSF